MWNYYAQSYAKNFHKYDFLVCQEVSVSSPGRSKPQEVKKSCTKPIARKYKADTWKQGS